MNYVIHDELGKLTGAYRQDLHPSHEGIYIEATDEQLANWVRYQANANFDGLELAPPPPPPAPIIPQQVSMRQACIQLEIDGLLDDVEALVATLPRIYQIEWQRASVVLRDNPLVEIVRVQRGMTAEQIDTLFINADKL